MIGKTFTRKSDKAKFECTGYHDAESTYSLSPVDFGPVLGVPAEALQRDFTGARIVTPTNADTYERSAWRKLADRFERSARRTTNVDGLLTPEEALSGHARKRAATIAADPDLLADYAIGLLPVSPLVAVALDDLLASEAADADRAVKRAPRDEDITNADAKRLGHRA